MNDERRPVLIGVGQWIERDVAPAEALSPLATLEEAARRAASDAGAGERLLGEVDTVAVVDVVGWRPHNPPALLSERLGAPLPAGLEQNAPGSFQ